MHDVVPSRLRRARQIPCADRVVEHDVDLVAARERLEMDLRARPAERARDAAEIERRSHRPSMPRAAERAEVWETSLPLSHARGTFRRLGLASWKPTRC